MKKIAERISAVSYKLIILSAIYFILLTSCTKEKIPGSQTTPPPPPMDTNKAPVAKAGNDALISLPTDTVWVDGSASFDPDGSIVSIAWRKIAGPNVFGNYITDHRSIKTKIKFSIAGTYAFELTATDNKGSVGKDTIQIVVQDFINPPSLTGREVIFENLVSQDGPPLLNSIIHSIQYSTPERPDLFLHPYVKVDVSLKFDSSLNWLPVTSLSEAIGGGSSSLYYDIYSSRLHVYDYHFNGQNILVKVKFR